MRPTQLHAAGMVAEIHRQPVTTENAAKDAAGAAPASEVRPRMQQALTSRRWAIELVLVVVLIAGLGSFIEWSRFRTPTQASGGRAMLVVLRFENLTGDANQDYFSDGLTEEMIGQLARLNPQQFGVIARSSVMHYRNKRESLQQIGRELGAQYVLEGSLRRELDQVRISAQLIQLK